MKSELEFFAFDVLGDFVDPKDISIDEKEKVVLVKRCPLDLVSTLTQEWERETRCTEWFDVGLVFLP